MEWIEKYLNRKILEWKNTHIPRAISRLINIHINLSMEKLPVCSICKLIYGSPQEHFIYSTIIKSFVCWDTSGEYYTLKNNPASFYRRSYMYMCIIRTMFVKTTQVIISWCFKSWTLHRGLEYGSNYGHQITTRDASGMRTTVWQAWTNPACIVRTGEHACNRLVWHHPQINLRSGYARLLMWGSVTPGFSAQVC